jgi:hypothetical protein
MHSTFSDRSAHARPVCHALHEYSLPYHLLVNGFSDHVRPSTCARSQSNRIGRSGLQLSDDLGLLGEVVAGGLQALCDEGAHELILVLLEMGA